jgi:hypothetical protein
MEMKKNAILDSLPASQQFQNVNSIMLLALL